MGGVKKQFSMEIEKAFCFRIRKTGFCQVGWSSSLMLLFLDITLEYFARRNIQDTGISYIKMI